MKKIVINTKFENQEQESLFNSLVQDLNNASAHTERFPSSSAKGGTSEEQFPPSASMNGGAENRFPDTASMGGTGEDRFPPSASMEGTGE